MMYSLWVYEARREDDLLVLGSDGEWLKFMTATFRRV
jgi:hypothetical protein